MRKAFVLTMSIIYLLIMTFCAYTPIVSQYIKDEDHFVDIDAIIVSSEYREGEYSYINIKLTEFERYYGFTGGMPESFDESVLENTVITLKVMPESAQLLRERGFFENVSEGTLVHIKTTCWIYDGINRHYLGSLNVDGYDYLTFDEGMRIIKKATRQLNKIELSEIFNSNND